jgi:hypothetical protein
MRSSIGAPAPPQQKSQMESAAPSKANLTGSLLESRQAQQHDALHGNAVSGSSASAFTMHNLPLDDASSKLRTQMLSDHRAGSPKKKLPLHTPSSAFSPDIETATINEADDHPRGLVRGAVGQPDINRARSQASDSVKTATSAVPTSKMVTRSATDYIHRMEPDPQLGNPLASGRSSRPQADGQYSATYADGSPIALRLSGPTSTPMLLTHEVQTTLRSPGPIGPIQPIGRPRPTLSSGHTDLHAEFSAKPSSNRKPSPPASGQTLGSAALSSGDDDVIIPAPRRVSHNTGVLGQSWNSSPAGIPSPHWNSSFAVAPTPIWGHTNLAPAGSHAWPSAPNANAFLPPRYDVSVPGNGPSDLFTSRGQAGISGMPDPIQPPPGRHKG